MIYNQLLQQAHLWGYVETFRYFGLASVLVIPFILFMKDSARQLQKKNEAQDLNVKK